MEITGSRHIVQRMIIAGAGLFLCLFFVSVSVSAQSAGNKLYVKGGKMFIELNKKTSDPALDSFITRYDFNNLELKRLLKSSFRDSLTKLGWKIETENQQSYILSKRLEGFDDINKPADRILFTEKNLSFDQRFPVVSQGVNYGYNRFKNKFPFTYRDSIVTFFLRNNKNARRVLLAGSFNDWDPDRLSMQRTDSGWIVNVKLRPGKYWYKFIVDGNWTTDRDNLATENDGLGNNNSVYFKPNYQFRVNAFGQAKKVFIAGSFNNWRNKELAMVNNGNGWELSLYLANGTHTYRYIVDGNWTADPGNPDRLPNEFNDYNSVVRIGKPWLFYLEGYQQAKRVMLTGSFNNWRKDELFMKKTASGWELPYTLGPGNHQYQFVADNIIVPQSNSIKNAGNSYFVIEPNHTFRLKGFANARNVYLTGDFNDWSPNTFRMMKEGDEWLFKAHLSPGKHLYKFVVDGKWILDPGNKLWEQNEHNTGNSVIWAEKKQ